jgi:3-phosphoshikimate 1-carboxyvinyltransferase
MSDLSRLPDPLSVPLAAGPVVGRVARPGSKSYTNRALPIAALARGESQLLGALDSDDTRYMVAALQTLGVPIEADWQSGQLRVSGQDGRLARTRAELFLGNSGTSMRFLTALVTLGQGVYRLDGSRRMRERPLGPLVDGLRNLGVDIRSETGNGCPPIVVRAAGLPGGHVTMRGDVSSQYFSAVAMVLPYAQAPLEIEVAGDLVSKPYLDMTARAMQDFGVTLRHENYHRVWVDVGQRFQGHTYAIEPDASAASYFFALAAVAGGEISVQRLPPTSLQGDLRFVDVLEQMGCSVTRGADAVTVVGPDQLRGVDVDMNDISDTVQTLAAIAPFADSTVTLRNVAQIRHKETDRLAACATELRRLGVSVEELPDGLVIQPAQPQPAVVQTYDDHRMAMSFAITATRSPGVRIADPACVAKTVPSFWSLLFPLLGRAA